MTTWILVYIVWGVYSVTSASIPGFKSLRECQQAATQVSQMKSWGGSIPTTCVQQVQ